MSRERARANEAEKALNEAHSAAVTRADEYRDALEFIQAAAASWHGDDAAKGRALSVIADCARAVLSRGDA